MVYQYGMCKTTVLNVNTAGIQLQVITDILTTCTIASVICFFIQQFDKEEDNIA